MILKHALGAYLFASLLLVPHTAVAQNAKDTNLASMWGALVELRQKVPKWPQLNADEDTIAGFATSWKAWTDNLVSALHEIQKADTSGFLLADALDMRWGILALRKYSPTVAARFATVRTPLQRGIADPSGPLPEDVAAQLLTEVRGTNLSSKDPSVLEVCAYWRAYTEAFRAGRTFAERLEAVDQFVAAYPSSPRVPDLLLHLASDRSVDASARVGLLDRVLSVAPEHQLAGIARSELVRQRLVGKPLPLRFDDFLTGSPVDTESLTGKVILIDFWGTWCPPCIREMPELMELYDELKPEGIEFVGVHVTFSDPVEQEKQIQRYLEQVPLPWAQMHSQKWAPELVRRAALPMPAKFIIGKDGKVVTTEAHWLPDQGGLQRLHDVLLQLAKQQGPPLR